MIHLSGGFMEDFQNDAGWSQRREIFTTTRQSKVFLSDSAMLFCTWWMTCSLLPEIQCKQ